jgi:hypothetical protein
VTKPTEPRKRNKEPSAKVCAAKLLLLVLRPEPFPPPAELEKICQTRIYQPKAEQIKALVQHFSHKLIKQMEQIVFNFHNPDPKKVAQARAMIENNRRKKEQRDAGSTPGP